MEQDSSVLIMEWKEEPLSPIFADELIALSPSDDDAPLFYWNDQKQSQLHHHQQQQSDDEQQGDEKTNLQYAQILVADAPVVCLSGAKIEPIDDSLLQNLEELKDLSEWIVEESNFPWLEDQIIFTAVESKFSPDSTECLFQEFENVLEAVDPGALTPPQSPPHQTHHIQQQGQSLNNQHHQPILTTLQPINVAPICPVYAIAEKQVPELADCPKTPQTLARELAVVDELVRARANDILCEPPSPSTSNSGSTFDDSSSEDPEWIPEPAAELLTVEKTRRRVKPYKISPVDKKNRKKEQNKNAATRYRMKKKAEIEEILSEEKSVLKENDALTGQISDLQREIRYLKGLMRDLLKAKGIIR